MINKVVQNAEEALSDLQDGMVLMLGGFRSLWYSRELYSCYCEKGDKGAYLYF